MKPIKEVYDFDEEYFYHCSYDPLIKSLEFEIIVESHDQDYQGDSRYLLKDGNRYGLLIFGWGSCSGCDALQACENIKQVESLREDLFNSIIWKDSKEDMLEFFLKRDWETQYSWHAKETRQFVKDVIEKFQKELGEY